MLIIVVVGNAMLALLLGMIAWRIWCWRRLLAQVAATLSAVEKSTCLFLRDAPDVIYRTQMGVYQLRVSNYQQLELQLQQLQQALRLLSWGQRAWRKQVISPLVWQSRKSLPYQRRQNF